jgi:hypothetical protein
MNTADDDVDHEASGPDRGTAERAAKGGHGVQQGADKTAVNDADPVVG